jgi:hypothetical protein
MTVHKRLLEILRTAAVYFSASGFAIIQFTQHSEPAPDVVYIRPSTAFTALALLILVPTLLLTVAHRVLVQQKRERAARALRLTVFGIVAVLVLRQVVLYFGAANAVYEALGDLSGLLGFAAFSLLAALVVYFCVRWERALSLFFLYAAPVTLFLAWTAVKEISSPAIPSEKHAEVASDYDPERSPVFVLLFDELSYDVVAPDGNIDAERYPNLAGLASEGAWFTNATTNYFHTPYIVPPMIRGVSEGATGRYRFRLYDQFAFVEGHVMDRCGDTITCRGQASYLSDVRTASNVDELAVRTIWAALPDPLEQPGAALLDLLGRERPAPNVDPIGIHAATGALWDTFMGDVTAEKVGGQIYFYHPLLPHYPFVYEQDGDAVTSDHGTAYDEGLWEEADVYDRYRKQMAYTDSLLGDFIGRLRDEGLYDDATIIITGDHGLRRIHPNIEEAIDVENEAVHVPLLVKGPGVETGVSDVDYQHVDFVPTVFDVLNLPAQTEEGVSAFSEERPHRRKVLWVASHGNKEYWEYTYRVATDSWALTGHHNGPLYTDDSVVAASID